MHTTIDENHLMALCAMPREDLSSYLETVRNIAEFRLRLQPLTPTLAPPQSPEPIAQTPLQPPSPLSRLPMRPPRPGSIREVVHKVLQQESPLSRAEVIRRVAKIQGIPVTSKFETLIGEKLRDRHDPFITKLERGVYAIR